MQHQFEQPDQETDRGLYSEQWAVDWRASAVATGEWDWADEVGVACWRMEWETVCGLLNMFLVQCLKWEVIHGFGH